MTFRCPSHSQIFRHVVLGRRTPRKKYLNHFTSLIFKTTSGICGLRTTEVRDVVNGVVITWIAHPKHLVRLLPMLPPPDANHAEIQLRACALELIYEGHSYGNH